MVKVPGRKALVTLDTVCCKTFSFQRMSARSHRLGRGRAGRRALGPSNALALGDELDLLPDGAGRVDLQLGLAHDRPRHQGGGCAAFPCAVLAGLVIAVAILGLCVLGLTSGPIGLRRTSAV